jgi:hypothetical protein
MMKRELTAIVLCMLAQAASADCVQATAANPAATVTANVATGTAPAVKPTARAAGTVQAPQNAARPGGELIKTAAAGTRDDAPPVPRATAGTRTTQDEEDHPHRDTTAMLLAALALMSGIALRRYGSRDA